MASALFTAVALAALALSAMAYRGSRQALSRTHPVRGTHPAGGSFALQVMEGRARRSISDDTREYALLVELANDSAHAIAVSSVALRVTYRTRANFLGAVDLQPDVPADKGPPVRPLLVLPAQLRPGERVTGWLLFRTVNVIPRHCRVQDYALVAIDAAGVRTLTDASLPALLAADTDGTGPATWGWD